MDIGNIYFSAGRVEEGYRAFIALWEHCGARCGRFREAQERGWAQNGPEGWARANLEVLTSIEGTSPWHVALVHTGFGETDEAFTWLERGYRERDPLMILLKADARFDPLRSDPRFQDLLRRIGFPRNDRRGRARDRRTAAKEVNWCHSST